MTASVNRAEQSLFCTSLCADRLCQSGSSIGYTSAREDR